MCSRNFTLKIGFRSAKWCVCRRLLLVSIYCCVSGASWKGVGWGMCVNKIVRLAQGPLSSYALGDLCGKRRLGADWHAKPMGHTLQEDPFLPACLVGLLHCVDTAAWSLAQIKAARWVVSAWCSDCANDRAVPACWQSQSTKRLQGCCCLAVEGHFSSLCRLWPPESAFL